MTEVCGTCRHYYHGTRRCRRYPPSASTERFPYIDPEQACGEWGGLPQRTFPDVGDEVRFDLPQLFKYLDDYRWSLTYHVASQEWRVLTTGKGKVAAGPTPLAALHNAVTNIELGHGPMIL